MSDDRYDENWQAYRCSDCDPTIDDEVEEYKKPYVMLVPEGENVPDHCPRCGSYLSLLDGDKGLCVTNTPGERWQKRREEEAKR
jgi:DNA-directed RNA polymerase subunit RPC12/RpoP